MARQVKKSILSWIIPFHALSLIDRNTSSFQMRILFLLLLMVAGSATVPAKLFAQATVATGTIQGLVSDPSGSAIVAAKITIASENTGQTIAVESTSAGTYSSGPLIPGKYGVKVEASGFKTVQQSVQVRVGNVTSADFKLSIGEQTEIVFVQSEAVQVDTQQSSVQGVLSAQEIQTLPINGRNFLDLAQLDPGVQIQDGTNFDPTKVGYSSISFQGRFGRSARIEVDGVDISDETVGTTTQDIPSSAIQEFQISQSSLDLSNELSSSGAVNVVTRSGSNQLHGEAFGLFRDSSAAANLPAGPGLEAPFQRSQFGGRFAGPILKDKFFFFVDAERTLQDLHAPVSLPEPFSAQSGTLPAPYRETETLVRADYQLTANARAFYRFTDYQSADDATFFPSSFQVYRSRNISHDHAFGLDFTTGKFSHSIRFNYLGFHNDIADATRGSGLPFADLPVSLNIGPFQTGPNLLAPQFTLQTDRQLKYDGSRTWGAHILRYGVDYNFIHDVGFAAFFSVAPQIDINLTQVEINFAENSCGTGTPCFPALDPTQGPASNPLNYPVELALFGTGQGFVSEKSALGQRAGGLGPDNRIGLYVGDTWRFRPNLTVNYGLRYVRDTGRQDSDLPAFPQLDSIQPGLGNRISQPNLNFAPQLGFAYDPWKNGKTSIRGGIGLFYDNSVFNNVYGDRPFRLQNGPFDSVTAACLGPGIPAPVPTESVTLQPSFCGTPTAYAAVGNVDTAMSEFESTLQSDMPFSLTTPNPGFFQSLANSGVNVTATTPGSFMLGPDYRTPRSLQLNIGMQREISRGTVLSADYLRNVATRFLLAVDQNHGGDVRYFNKNAALAAISATNTAFGCGAGTDSASIDCAIGAGATMASYATNGLGSPGLDFGGPCPIATGCAFSGLNPAYGTMSMANSIGRSVYNALQMKLTQQVARPLPGMLNLNTQVSYSLSRFVSPGAGNYVTPAQSDEDLVNNALDNSSPLRYMGPNLLDRTHQLSFGVTGNLVHGFEASIVSHFYSPLSLPIVVPNTGLGPGEIFRTDFTGDGTVEDPMPGTKMGSFGRDVNGSSLNNLIQHYNQKVAGQPTPAGQVLVSNGLFTSGQLATPGFGGVAPTVPLAPAGQVSDAWLRALDFKLAWRYSFPDRLDHLSVEPSMGVFNTFNFSNYDLPPGLMSPLLAGSPGSINGTDQANRIANRVGVGTGVFSLGSPRVFEFGLRIEF
jgi:hypothetical protein